MTTSSVPTPPVSSSVATDDVQHMLKLLRRQASLFAGLETLTSSQRGLVTSEDTGPLLRLLADRQKLSTELADIASHLDPVRRDWPEVRKRLTPEQRADADRYLSESGKRLQRIMESDEQDARVLGARKRMVTDTLRGAHDTGQAISAYQRRGGARPGVTRLDEAS